MNEKAVPPAVFSRLLALALQPPAELLQLPFTATAPRPAESFVSLHLRPVVCPAIPGFGPRRAMETRFRNAVGRPPHMEIRRVQLERVKELLVNSDYKLEKIADMTGFSSAQYLAGLFHRVVGVTPGTWRQTGRARGGPVAH